jgi:hypothetical protein
MAHSPKKAAKIPHFNPTTIEKGEASANYSASHQQNCGPHPTLDLCHPDGRQKDWRKHQTAENHSLNVAVVQQGIQQNDQQQRRACTNCRITSRRLVVLADWGVFART